MSLMKTSERQILEQRDWFRMTETYRISLRKHLSTYEGRNSLANRLHHKVDRLKFQFLPHYAAGVPRWRLKLRSFGCERTLPDFACVGPIKSGTTDLAVYLFQHPCILPPLSKEIRTLNTKTWPLYFPTIREKAKVSKDHGAALAGYFYPRLENMQLIDNYHSVKPDAKIIIMLRNPVDRAYSHYKWDLFLGGKRLEGNTYYASMANYVNTALDCFPAVSFASYCGWQLLPTGIYWKSVELWINRFGRENVHVMRSEDFFKDAASAVCGVHEFLGIPPIKPEVHAVVHENPLKTAPMDEETRVKLQAFYRPWNEKLYNLLDRDLGWD